jgi:uncharacterized membrane-anchored protein YhcB (DUF1043 family)
LTDRKETTVIKRAIVVGFGAIIGMLIAKRMSHKMREQMHHKMREHCMEMASQCKEMASQFRDRQPTATA